MKIYYGLIILIFPLFITCTSTNKKENGVWANKDCELLRTDKFVLFFERSENEISATLQQIEKSDNKIKCKLIGKVIFKDSVVSYKYFNPNIDSLIDENTIGIVKDNGQIEIKSKKTQTLDLIEKIKVVDSYDMLKVNEKNIGLCLEQWILGTTMEVDKKNNSITFEAGTNKHNYCFVLNDGFIYCRASRRRSNINGTLGSQNIRLMANTREQTKYMKEDNLKFSSSVLKVNDKKFNKEKCYSDEDGNYWTIKSFVKDTIYLNGCGGDIYKIVRNDKTSTRIFDWVEFEKY